MERSRAPFEHEGCLRCSCVVLLIRRSDLACLSVVACSEYGTIGKIGSTPIPSTEMVFLGDTAVACRAAKELQACAVRCW